jgi:putative transposase
MQRFKSLGHAQRFLSSFELIRQHFHPKQHLLPANEYRQVMRQQLSSWRELTGTQIALPNPNHCCSPGRIVPSWIKTHLT